MDLKSEIFRVVRLLYVEDNAEDLQFLMEDVFPFIRDPVFEMTAAGTIADAIHKLDGGSKYDVILLDMFLPNGEGIATVRKMLEHSGTTPIVVMSAFDDETLARRAVTLGVQDYLLKGEFNAKGFKRAIMHSLYRAKSRKTAGRISDPVKSRAITRLEAMAEW